MSPPRTLLWLLLGAWILIASPATGQQTAPAATSAGTVTVTSVSGPAQKMDTSQPEPTWQPLAAGDTLGEKTLIRTGLRTKLVLRFEDRGEVTLTGPGKMGISQFRPRRRSTTTRLGLKYGTVRASVDRTQGPHDFRVSTPVATLSVRGSKSRFACLPDNNRGLKTQVDEGTWNSDSSQGSQNAGKGENTDNTGEHNDEINQKQGDTEQGDAFGQTGDEKDNQNKNGDGRGDWRANDYDDTGVPRFIIPQEPSESEPEPNELPQDRRYEGSHYGEPQ